MEEEPGGWNCRNLDEEGKQKSSRMISSLAILPVAVKEDSGCPEGIYRQDTTRYRFL